MRTPRSGDVLAITRQASVQFQIPFQFRVIRMLDLITYEGWIWLDGYQLNSAGDAIDRRSIFVQIHGLRWVGDTTPRPRNDRTGPYRRPESPSRRAS
ncbi:hypothetical protein [Actinoplanes siamensis]|uniref:Uncharacterized protein n=1 Tax=Actinoplanes siamensis TaxID=1223317 RepID=A0A919N9N9_9ACTN|nr:hypothetical protein [Actinoplanes siamensis]GIF07114.1 hypothetical protein Asi03nite_46520 [Actinoplanes siamensis]